MARALGRVHAAAQVDPGDEQERAHQAEMFEEPHQAGTTTHGGRWLRLDISGGELKVPRQRYEFVLLTS